MKQETINLVMTYRGSITEYTFSTSGSISISTFTGIGDVNRITSDDSRMANDLCDNRLPPYLIDKLGVDKALMLWKPFLNGKSAFASIRGGRGYIECNVRSPFIGEID